MRFLKQIILTLLLIGPVYADELQQPETITMELITLLSEKKYEAASKKFNKKNISEQRKAYFDYFDSEIDKLEETERALAMENIILIFGNRTKSEILGMDEHDFLALLFQIEDEGHPELGLLPSESSNYKIIQVSTPNNAPEKQTVRYSYTEHETDFITGQKKVSYETDFLDFHKVNGKWEPLLPDLNSILD